MSVFLFTALLAPAADFPAGERKFEYVPAGCGNPLQGLVPYAGAGLNEGADFPYTLEFNYLPLSDLAPEEGRFDFGPMETLLDEIASRGHQAVVRVYMEYPAEERSAGFPKWLEDQGVKVTEWTNPEANEHEQGLLRTPDYEDPRVRKLLVDFIAAWGARHDGDPRLGFITAGLLGTWGEWHTYPRDDLFASKQTQDLVLDAFERAFVKTPVLLRYPAGEDAWQQTKNTDRGFGYHDDSFAWATLETGRKQDDWFYMHLISEAGAEEAWKEAPIGGEVRPELWGKIFDAPPGQPKKAHKKAQDFAECVEVTHASWLLESGVTTKKQPARRLERAKELVARMGYEHHINRAQIVRSADGLSLHVCVTQKGVAPLYHDWKPVLAVLGDDGRVLQKIPTDWSLAGILPRQYRIWVVKLPDLPAEAASLAVRVPNALPNGPSVRFANDHVDGWVTLAERE